MPSPRFPEPPAAIPPTPRDQIDAAIARVASRKDDWTRVAIPDRIRLLHRCTEGVEAIAREWAELGTRAKGLAPDDTGEEWVVGPSTTLRNLRLFVSALEQLGRPKVPKVWARDDGQIVARIFPADAYDRMLFTGFTCEVWMEPGMPATQGRIYREPSEHGKTCLVLGAGNVSSISPMDALYKLFVENEVVVLKTNPVNGYLGPLFERAFAALIEPGYMAIVHGGAAEGSYLAEHPQIDTLHVTGSDKTYDAIVWGASQEEQQRRKASGDRKNKKPFSAELGCVTPVIVVPGPWSAADLDFQARQVAGMVAHNASFNCTAAKVLVTAKGWLQRETFLRKVDEHLAHAPTRKAYYPGAADRWRAFLDKYPRAKALSPERDGGVPWTVIPDVTDGKGEYALSNEAFCGVLAEVALDAGGPAEFLAQATAFANERCWGTLSCCVLVHPTTQRDHATELDRAIASLRYGAIGINCWSSVAYALVSPTWGAFPGHAPEDIQSGSGVVHNAFLFDHPQKSVVRAPWRIRPTPVWFADHKNLRGVGERLARLEAHPSLRNVASTAVQALRG